MRSYKYIIVFIPLIALMLCACDSNGIYDAYVSIPQKGWSKDSVARFNFNIEASDVDYNMYIKLRNTAIYPNSNLWLFIDIIAPSGVAERDTVECLLADDKGEWYGRGWGSGIYHLTLPYKYNIKFNETGTYKMLIAQGMRSPVIKGIVDVGVRIEKFED